MSTPKFFLVIVAPFAVFNIVHYFELAGSDGVRKLFGNIYPQKTLLQGRLFPWYRYYYFNYFLSSAMFIVLQSDD